MLLVQAGTDSEIYPFRSHPLGLMYLGAALRRARPGIDVRILDMKVERHTPESVAALCLREKFDVAGVGGFSVHADILYSVAGAIRAACPDIFLVGGGPHPSCHPESVLRSSPFDAVVSGEGEAAFPRMIDALESNGDVSTVPGTTVPKNGAFASTPPAPIEDPDALPVPAWDLINPDAYARVSSFSILGRRRYMSLFTSRGCPYQCIYCHGIFGKKYRPRGAANVAAEAEEIIGRFGIRDFDILDDVFNLQPRRVREICEAFVKIGGLTLAFPNGLRSDLLNEETLRLMRRAGTRYISFAVEAASPRLQKLMRKNLDLEKTAEAVRIASRLGIFCNGFLMLGFPTETEDELQATVRFAVKSPMHTAHFLKVTPFEGTEMFEMMRPNARRTAEAMPDALKYYDRSFNLSDVENRRFNRILAAAHRRFYLNPFRLLRLIQAHPRRKNLLQFAAFAVRRIILSSSKGA